MDGAAALHQALAGETFLEKERRLSEMIRQLQMVREQLLSQQELHGKVGRGISLPNVEKSFRGLSGINRHSARKHYTLRDFCRLAIEPIESFGAFFFLCQFGLLPCHGAAEDHLESSAFQIQLYQIYLFLLIGSSVYCMSVYVTMTLLTDRCGNYV
jgi:hypothetical protein